MESGYNKCLLLKCLMLKYLLAMFWVILLICGLSSCGLATEIGDVRLAEGTLPNMGRVEIYLGDRGWFTTCDPTWDINDAIVVCRQLGFPGAAFARAAESYRAIGVPLSRTVKCTGYETNLLDCPYHTTALCTSAVGVVCQEPGYVGCYADEPSNSMFHAGHDHDKTMDLAKCKAFCRTKRALYVGLKNANECHCGINSVPLGQPTHEKVKDSECQIPCLGNKEEICGGVSTRGHYVVSVHHMNAGECSTLSSPTNGFMLDTEYSFGQVVRFQCDKDYSLVGSRALICDVNRGLGENRVAWNATAPVCVVSPVTSDNQVWLPTRGSTGKLLADKPGIILVIALIVVLALCVPAFTFVAVRRYFAKRKVIADSKSDKPYQDLLYNPSTELNSYEPLRPPRKRDGQRKQGEDQLQQQKTKTAPSGIHLDDPYTTWHQQDFGANHEPLHNSMHNLMISRAMPQIPRNGRNARSVASFKQKDDTQMYGNGNTLNFKKQQATRSFRSDSVRNIRNTEMNRHRQEDDEVHYAVAI